MNDSLREDGNGGTHDGSVFALSDLARAQSERVCPTAGV